MTCLLPVKIFNLVMIKVSTPEGNIHRDLIRPCDLSPDQDHSCELTHFCQKIQSQGPKCDFCGTNSSWFELKGLISGTCPMKSCFSPHVYCSCDLHLRPNKKKSTNQKPNQAVSAASPSSCKHILVLATSHMLVWGPD